LFINSNYLIYEGFMTALQYNNMIFRNASIEEFYSGKYDGEVEARLKEYGAKGDRVGLRELCYAVFAGIFIKSPCSREEILGNLHNEIRWMAMDQLIPRINTAYQKTKVHLEKFVKYEKERPLAHIAFVLNESVFKNEASRQFWYKHIQKESTPYRECDDMVFITHGGGYNSVADFLEGRSIGYPLEGDSGFGLQVHPHKDDDAVSVSETSSREVKDYSVKAYDHFDRPCRFSAWIPARYLEQAPNGYEAGLKAENVTHLEDVTIELLTYETIAPVDDETFALLQPFISKT
jgi:hypothetical protein